MKKINAYTFVEIMLTLIIMMIIATFCYVSFGENYKNQKLRIYAYSTIDALMSGLAAVANKNNYSIYGDGTSTWTCKQLVNYISLKSSNCSATGANTDNIVFTNGVAIRGLSSAWKSHALAKIGYYYKDILMDINGSAAPNKLYVDQLPLRIFTNGANDRIVEGIVQPVNCGTPGIYDADGNLVVAAANTKHAYCSTDTTNLAQDNSIISYDIYKAKSPASSEASAVITNLSAIEADCLASGSDGIYTKAHCNALGYTISAQCYYHQVCDVCGDTTATGYCKNSSGTAQNKIQCLDNLYTTDTQCFTVLHRPL